MGHEGLTEIPATSPAALLAAVSAAAEYLRGEAAPSALPARLQHVLSLLGEAAGASAAHIYQFDRPTGTAERSRWASNTSLPPSNNDRPELELSVEFWEEVAGPQAGDSGMAVHGPVADLPDAVRTVVDPAKVRSVALQPVLVRDRLWGFIELDDGRSERRWSLETLDALRLVAYLISETVDGPPPSSVQVDLSVDTLDKMSEARYHQMLTQLPGIFWTTDSELRFTSSRGGALATLNLKANQVVGLTLMDFFQTTDRSFQPIAMHLQALKGNGVSYENEWHGRTFQCRVEPFLDERDRIVGVIGLAYDITELKQTKSALHDSEQHFRLTEFAVEVAAEAMFTVAPDGRILSANRTACKQLEYTREELLNMRIADIDPHYPQELWPEHWRELQRVGKSFIETQHRTKSGRILDVEVSISYFQFHGVEYCCSSIRDITERKRSERQLEFTQFAVDQSRTAIFWMRQDGRFVYVNDAACQSLGYSRDELLAMAAPEIAHNVTPERWAQIFGDLDRYGTYSGELHHRRKDGSVIPVEVSANRLDWDGKKYHVAFVIDITGRRAAEERLRQHRDELAHVTRLSTMGEMATGIAHELNQPLAAIANYAAALESSVARNVEADNALKFARAVQEQAIRAGKIVHRVRNFVKKTTPARVPEDLNVIIREALGLLSPELIQSGIELRARFGQDLPQVIGDSVQIQQVLVNLIRNASEAMEGVPRNERVLTIHTELFPPGQLQVIVQDSGVGFQQQDLESIFAAFHTSKPHGMGMGLAISRSIAEAHGGQLVAQRAPSRGAIFRMVLPIDESVRNQDAVSSDVSLKDE